MSNIPITYFGVLRAPTSWAKVGREMCASLIEVGADLNIFERKGFLFDPCMQLPHAVEAKIRNVFRPEPVFSFEHPKAYEYLQGDLKVGLLTYESTVVPPSWIREIQRHLDLLVLPSTFCRDLFVQAGIPIHKCAIIPYGYRPDTYYRNPTGLQNPNGKVCRFITVASPHKREGIEVLLDAYRNAFTIRDDVSLTIKVNYLPKKKGRSFEHIDLIKSIEDFKADSAHPPIEVISDFLSEKEMADLYRSGTCFVSATRGEGFGMAFVEAFACGLEIVVTGWSGHMDYLNDQNAHLVAYRLRKAKEIQYDCQDKNALIAEPDLQDLAEKMCSVYQAYKSSALRTKSNTAYLEDYTWRRIAQKFLDLINDR